MGCCGSDVDESSLEEDKKKELKGPLEDRGCTDIIMLLVFVCFVVGMVAIAGVSLRSGDPRRIVYGTDSWGNLCGRDNEQAIDSPNSGLDLSDQRYLMYSDPGDDNAFRMCVAECPSTTTADCTTCAANGYCLSSASNNYQALTNPPEPLNEDCPPNLFETRELQGTRRCIPTDANAFNSVVDSLNEATNAEDIISDIILGYWLIGYCVLIALGLAFIGIILMRCFAKPMVYSLILLGMLGSLLLSVYSYQEWKRLDDKIDEQEEAGLTPTESDEDNRSFMYGFMIASFIFTAIVWILVIALRNRIRLAVTIFQEASRAVASMPLIFLTPIYTYAVVILFVAYWIVVFAYMITSGEAEEDVNGHVRYNDSGQSNFTEMFWYHIFGFFWILEFILACAQISLAGAFATWYFTRDKSSIHLPYTRSVGRLIRYHLGTAAFGSLVIAIVSFIRAVITFVHNRTKDRTGVIASVAVKMCICCLWCLEKCLKFLNKNAYIETAIYGHNFCTAARKAFFLLLKNLARVATLNFITWFMLFVIRLLVVAATGCAAYYWIQNNSELEDGLNYWGVLVFIICILAYFVSGVFFNIFDMAIDTIFICFVEDSSRNNGNDKPYYMSDNLKKFMDKSASNEAA